MGTKEVELVNIRKIDESGETVELNTQPSATAEQSTPIQSPSNSVELLTPGTKIRPDVTEEDAIKLAERLYGITTSEICPLISYDDRNFLIHVDRNIKNPIIPNTWPHGYVLKITNALDSKKTDIVDAQTQLLLFLSQQNIQCPRPVMNIYGKYHSLEKIGNSQHNVRLFEFQPGKTFQEVLKTNNLYYQVGEFMAKVDIALKNFNHDAFDNHGTIWHLESLPKLSEFLHAVTDVEKRDVVEQVMAAFDAQVLKNLDKFDKGVIHGDFNSHNILVSKTDKPNEFKVSGIIDFGDTCHSCYVFELAIAIAYMILQSEDIETGGLVIAGYGMIKNIPQQELDVLKVCVAARLCQSLVLGAYTHLQDPDNEYVLFTQKAGWQMLLEIWAQPPNTLEDLWSSTADNYLKQSYK